MKDKSRTVAGALGLQTWGRVPAVQYLLRSPWEIPRLILFFRTLCVAEASEDRGLSLRIPQHKQRCLPAVRVIPEEALQPRTRQEAFRACRIINNFIAWCQAAPHQHADRCGQF